MKKRALYQYDLLLSEISTLPKPGTSAWALAHAVSSGHFDRRSQIDGDDGGAEARRVMGVPAGSAAGVEHALAANPLLTQGEELVRNDTFDVPEERRVRGKTGASRKLSPLIVE